MLRDTSLHLLHHHDNIGNLLQHGPLFRNSHIAKHAVEVYAVLEFSYGLAKPRYHVILDMGISWRPRIHGWDDSVLPRRLEGASNEMLRRHLLLYAARIVETSGAGCRVAPSRWTRRPQAAPKSPAETMESCMVALCRGLIA